MSHKNKKQCLQHGMLLDAKSIMDDALPSLQLIRSLVPERLHDALERMLSSFEEDLAGCDVSGLYTDKP